MSRSRPRVETYWLGSVPYRAAWDLQRKLVERVHAGEAPDTLLLLEHPHVFTVGRRGTADHILWDAEERERRKVDVVWTDRGGDVTYHGPGQLVGYPILDLRRHGGDILAYLRRLESSLAAYLSALKIEANAVPGLTGVWSDGRKVAAIGVRLTDSVTSHGFALNLTTDLDYFCGIVPCGLSDKEVCSVQELIDTRIETGAAAESYARFFGAAFGCDVRWRKENRLARVKTSSESPLHTERRALPVVS